MISPQQEQRDRFAARRTVVIAAMCLAVCHLVPMTLARPTERQLIANGGFEQGLQGWQPDARYTRIKDAKACRGGRACLFGEVTKPNNHLRLVKTVDVSSANLYEFEIWARATNRTKLVLWARMPGAERRQMICAWQHVPGKWKRYTTPITVTADGTMTLEIIAPSSHGAPPGKMWLDNVRLTETRLPPATCVSQGQGFNDEPTMAAATDGTVYVAWNSFRDGGDTIQVARYRVQSDGLDRLSAWQALGGRDACIACPRLVPAGQGVMLLATRERGDNWDIVAVPIDTDGPGKATVVTSDPGVDAKPVGVWHDGLLWVAWESNRGGVRRVWATKVGASGADRPQPVSPAGVSAYAPSITALPGGEVCIAWHAFVEDNYDVYLRPCDASGTWRPVQRLTTAPAIDRHPVLLSQGSELWLLYEHAETKGYRIGATNRRRILVARIDGEKLLAPNKLDASSLAHRCEAPTARFDRKGRLWVAYLAPRLPRSGWDAFLTCYTGKTWLPRVRLSGRKGLDRAPGLAICVDTVVAAIQCDNIPGSWPDADKTATATSDIYAVTCSIAKDTPVEKMALSPLVEPDEPFEAGELRQAYGEDASPKSLVYQGKTLHLYHGSLHEHSDVSVCNRCGDQSLDESYQHLRDIARLDFACMTDHGYNQSPYLWHYSAKLARLNDDPNRFVTFLGFEWTSTFEKYSDEHPFGYYGHRNLILSDLRFPRWWNARNGQTPAEVWAELRAMKADFVHIPHQLGDTGNVPTDWSFHDEHAQPVAEIWQIRGSYEYDGAPRQAKRSTPKGYYMHDAWARGLVIGVIASPDHGGGVGKACVYAPEQTREALLEALRRRHCFGTTAARVFLDVRVNGHLMGEKIAPPEGKPVEIRINVQCPQEIDRIEVCRNNVFIHCERPSTREADLVFVDDSPLEGKSYYYVRVIQKDEEIAWSSPVWLGYK